MRLITGRIGAIVLFGGLSLAGARAWAQQVPLVCDADNNGVIDSRDITIIGLARNTPASGPTDPRDPNRDGIVNVLDGRFCATLCTLPNCAKAPAIPAPLANAGADQQVAVGATVQLNGSASTSARGDALSYQWSLVSAPAGSGAVLANPTAVRPTFVADKAGLYDLELQVTDAHAVASLEASVLIGAGTPVPPTANAGKYATAAVGAQITLDATQSTDVSGAQLFDYWKFILVPANSTATLSSPGVLNPTFITDLPGQYYLQLSVTDGNYNTAAANVVVDTQPRTAPPTANAGPGQQGSIGQRVLLDASQSTAPAGTSISAYQWVLLSKPAASAAQLATATLPQATFAIDVAGDYVAQLIVTANGLVSAPATVLISTHDVPPIANAGAAQSVFVGDTAFLRGTGTAPDGNPLTFRWALIDAPSSLGAVSFVGTNTATPSLVTTTAGTVPGTYVAQLIVNNGHVDSAPSNVVIQVNTPTTADLGITQQASSTNPIVGGTVQLTINLSNTGPLNAAAATVSDLLPAGLHLLTAAPSQGSYNGSSGIWTVGSLANGGSAQLILTASVTGVGTFINTAAIAASTPNDPNSANNIASISISPVQGANLSIVTTVSNSAPTVGANVVFTTTVTNGGPAAATAAQVADLLPSGFAFVSAQAGSGSYNASTGVWTIGTLPNGGSATLVVTATVLATGSYADTATVTATNAPNTGANISSTVTVVPTFPPTVSITAPANGTKYIAPASINLTVVASSATGIATLSILDGGAIIQSVPVNGPGINITFTLSGVAAGTHTYSAVATDIKGLAGTSNSVQVIVIAPTATASLLAPTNGAFFVAPATITLLAAASSTTGSIARVQFFQNGTLVGTATSAPYSVSLTGLATGSYTFTAQVTDSTSTVTASASAVTVGGASTLTVVSPVNGASIADDVIATLSGTVQAPPNSAIVVNGLPATVTPDGRYFANNVPLQAGSNIVQVTLSEPNGTVTTQSVTVNSTAVQPFQVATTLLGPNGATAGLPPLAVEFTVADSGQVAATGATVSCSDDGNIDLSVTTLDTSGAVNSLGSCGYGAPGVYTARINVINAPSGQAGQIIYTSTLTIVVIDPAALDALLRSTWSGMANALVAGDRARALSYLDDPAQATYGPVFSSLSARMPGIFASCSDLTLSSVGQSIAKYLMVRTVQGTPQAFIISFVNTGGVWQLENL